jgi:transposase-like protein
VVGIFPDRGAVIRLVGAVLMEQTDEWTEARRYMGLEFLAKACLRVLAGETPDQDSPQQATTA